MAKPGRKPRTAKENERLGNPRKQRKPPEDRGSSQAEPKPKPAPPPTQPLPTPPVKLSPTAQKVWGVVVSDLVRRRTYTEAVSYLVASYVQWVARAVDLEAKMGTNIFKRLANGDYKPSPEFTLSKQCWKEAREIASKLGINCKELSRPAYDGSGDTEETEDSEERGSGTVATPDEQWIRGRTRIRPGKGS